MNPLWSRIVDSGDKRHAVAGTQVRTMSNSSEALKIATIYAGKFRQKSVPDDCYHVGRFWGSSLAWFVRFWSWKT